MTYAEQEAKMKELFNTLWVPVEKELPPSNDSVYVKYRVNSHEFVDISSYDKRLGWVDEDGYRYDHPEQIIAWMWYITPEEI